MIPAGRSLCLLLLTSLCLAALLASPALAQDPGSPLARLIEKGYAPGSVLVRFRPGVGAAAIDAVAAELGMEKIRDFDEIGVSLFKVPEGSVEATLDSLAGRGEVEFAEPNTIRRTFFTPNDPRFGEQWGLAKIDVESAWDVTFGSPDVVVALIDTGIDQDHPELMNQRWVNTDEIAGNGIDDDHNGYVDDRFGYDFFGTPLLWGLLPPPEGDEDPDPEDDNGHGSHTAGIVAAATNNGIGVAGTAPGCRIMVVRALGGLLGFGYSSDIISAMLYAADNGADVISMSLGSTQFSKSELAAAAYCEDHDVLLVAAAGNGGNTQINYPAGYPQVMAVSATTSSDGMAGFSTTGANVEVGAPGKDVLSTWKGGGYRKESGTSMACPHAAGVCALVRSLYPAVNADQARLMVREGARDLGAPGWDKNFGDGRLDAPGALAAAVPDPAQVRLLTPGDGSTINSGSTPYGFGWTRTAGAATYRLQFELPGGSTATLKGTDRTFFYPSAQVWSGLPAGTYRWRAAAVKANGQVISVSPWWSFVK